VSSRATCGPARSATRSVAQEIAATVPGAKVVKAFNTTFAGTLVEGKVAGHALDVFIASDDEGAKSAVQQLAADGGLRPIDVGPLALAHHLEALGYLNMAIQPSLGTNYGSAIEVLA
jgi:predicted dinucleotide-binding enzyme